MATTRKGKRGARRIVKSASETVRLIKHDAGIGEPMSAIALLKADHREVEGLFKEFEKTESTAQKLQLARRICAALRVHTTIEEEIFYPAFLAATQASAIHDEAQVEHDGAKKLIAEIESSRPGQALFDAKVTVLSEMIKHHVREEERFGGMFAKARWSKLDLNDLGRRMRVRKAQLMPSPARRAIGKARASRGAVARAAAMNASRGARGAALRH